MNQLTPTDIQSLQWLTVREVANRLNLPVDSVIQKIEAGEIRAVKFGDEWRVHTRVLETVKGLVRA